ncbi:MAG: hypothetical protein HC808_06585 [Candidatus Competibacteraceae bacterium]|nr:hypothetical protein [Candidatus Competibacteraceae bacterium]
MQLNDDGYRIIEGMLSLDELAVFDQVTDQLTGKDSSEKRRVIQIVYGPPALPEPFRWYDFVVQ